MKILFELPHDRLTGVNTFTYTIAKYMHNLGNDIRFILLAKEANSDTFISKISEIGTMNTIIDTKYDIIFMCSSYCVELLKNIAGKKIFIGHGLHHESYFPNTNDI